ncbi:MAG: tRNA (N(6)-L-threonylcarbamoyladenosine(37)-C(2))-methylthiotransferase MtaB [Desulfitobacteriaceae bacterium]
MEHNVGGQARSSVGFVTLGCKVNQVESEALAQLFRNAGYEVMDIAGKADVVVVNTCTVTNTGGSKSRQVIRRMIKSHPDSFIVVMGCYAQTSPGEVLNIEGVDLVIGTQDRSRMLELIEQARAQRQPLSAVHDIWQVKEFEELPMLEGESRTRAMLKIQEGCNQFCTYCIIPYARGPVRSRRAHNALAEAEKLVQAGYKEIVLTGIHTGAYGQDMAGDWDLARLVRELVKIDGLKRLRLSSIEPMEFAPVLLESIFSSPVVCPHLHIPLQSGSDAILARMQRPYTLGDYKGLLNKLLQNIPDLAVTTDVIVGFPGESERDHRDALAFVESCGFARIHVFPYSRREGTPAAGYPDQVPNRLKEERVKEMLEVARSSHESYVERFLGREVEVLVERVDASGTAFGHTGNYLEVYLPRQTREHVWHSGELVKITLAKAYLKEENPS